jgi:hypothetical protein
MSLKSINIFRISCKIGEIQWKLKTQIFNFVHTTRFCQPLSGILKDKRLDRQIVKKTKEPKQDQIWLKSYECSEKWIQRDFGMVLSPILGGCQLVLFLYQQCFWTILCTFQIIFNLLCIYYSIVFSMTIYSQFQDVLNWLRNC